MGKPASPLFKLGFEVVARCTESEMPPAGPFEGEGFAHRGPWAKLHTSGGFASLLVNG